MTALESMAAAARPPGIGDARTPCPLCGGLIHPVAGRCKHCKEDLTQFRAGRPQAAAELPALNALARPPVSPFAPPTNGTGTNGYMPAAPAAAVPVAIPVREPTQPILPPRPTGRSMKAERPRSALWRSWPMLVIGLAVVAIVIATVIMVLPQGSSKGGRKLMNPPAPAPERMDTDPLQKQGLADPWGQGGAPDPNPRPLPPDDPDDLLGQLPQGGMGGGFSGNGGSFMNTIFEKTCSKLKTCPGANQSMLATACDQFSALPKAPPPTNCPSAQRCLDAIDKLDCTQAVDTSPLTIGTIISDCGTALNDC